MVNDTGSNILRYKDALVLYSLYRPTRVGQKVGIEDLIAFYDYIDHDILTFNELSESLQRLCAIGWVETFLNSACVTKTYYAWRSKKIKGKISIHKELKEIETYLNTNPPIIRHLQDIPMILDQVEFDKAQKKYLSGSR